MEPVTLAATTIATLAFIKFLEGSAGKAAEKFTEAAFVKMDELRKQIWTVTITLAATSGDDLSELNSYLRAIDRQ